MAHATAPVMATEPMVEMIERTASQWSGRGSIVECGSWLGGSALAVTRGLEGTGYDREIHLFDYFRCRSQSESDKAFARGVTIEVGQDTLPIVREYLDGTGYRMVYHVGDVGQAYWPDSSPIELFLLDTAKRGRPFNHVMETFSKAWIPGVTIIGLLDYYYYRKIACPGRAEDFRHQEKWIERHKQSFEQIEHHGSAAWFRYIQPVDR